jgi:N,N-dimethylformamidase
MNGGDSQAEPYQVRHVDPAMSDRAIDAATAALQGWPWFDPPWSLCMIPLAGYADRLSARPGDSIRFHVSNATGVEVSGRIVRVSSADANPAGPGIKIEPVAGAVFAARAVGSYPAVRGSYAVADLGEHLSALDSFTLSATIWPTRLGHDVQPIISWLDPIKGTGVSFEIGSDCRLTAIIGLSGGVARVEKGPLLDERAWVDARVSYDAATGLVTVSAVRTDTSDVASASVTLPRAMAKPVHGKLCIGASSVASFNGKIEHPRLYASANHGDALTHWDFAQDMGSSRIVDLSPLACHGQLINQPTRAVTGSNWSGREMCWRHAPEQYSAIHFHDDDIDDCNWPVAFEWVVPLDLRSGCYALLLDAGIASDNIPVFIVPPLGKPRAAVAVLVSTYTYTVYGNHARPEWQRDPAWQTAWVEQAKSWNAYPHNPGAHADYGLSTYNFHSDGSGIGHASWHRPMLNLRIGYITYPYPDIRASGLRHYPADMHLIAWLEAKGFAYDIITDAELDAEGQALLQPYATVMTGSHPEYHTSAMLDALESYRDGGGRLIYLGGNGFYWKIALNPVKAGCVEIRRAEGGIRSWAAETGEYYNQFDGEYGGLWRRNGRPPQKLVGVGFTAQGNFVGSHYRIAAEARNSRAGWMFDGIAGDLIGDFGFSGHGAAGFELDRAEKRLGTPAHALIVAASEGHKPDAPWVLVPEEQLTHIVTWAGEPAEKLIRADITFFETANHGAVFSVGSITFCGALPHNGFDNSISRLLQNVLDRFQDRSTRFELPKR